MYMFMRFVSSAVVYGSKVSEGESRGFMISKFGSNDTFAVDKGRAEGFIEDELYVGVE